VRQPTTIQHQDLDALPMRTDPARAWHTMRSWGDVFRDERGVWYLTTADTIAQAVRTPEVFSSQLAYERLNYPVQQIPVAVDPPDHARYRRTLEPLFSTAAVRSIEPRLRRQARRAIAALPDPGRCDVVRDLAVPFPTRAFVSFFGMPLDDVDQLTAWVHVILKDTPIGNDPETVEHAQAVRDLFAYITLHLEAKRASPSDDVLSRLISLRGADRWTVDELRGLMFVMMTAGLDTVTQAIGHLFHALASNSELRDSIIAEGKLIGPLIEEVLRTSTVAPFIPRVARVDTSIGGHTIPAGATVVLVYGAANRDPDRYPNQDVIELTRTTRGHYSFGLGIHRCLGSHLARVELRVLVEEFHRTYPRYHVMPDWSPDLPWPASMLGLRSLPLALST
jgi:cytochrome P450